MIRIVVSVLCLLPSSTHAQEPQALKLACLGDSITWGSGVVDRENNSYPKQLGYLLGDGWEVRNFGSGGKTLLSAGDTPYVECAPFQAALAWKPDVALVLLGTNDTCNSSARPNWQHAADLEQDARELAQGVLDSNPMARVVLCTPPPMFPDAPGLDEARVVDLRERSPRLAVLASALKQASAEDPRIEFLDLSHTLRAQMTVDGVHTNPFGAGAIAQRAAEALQQDLAPPIQWSAEVPASAAEFQGYAERRFSLRLADNTAFQVRIVEPVQPAAGYPWIWRARFFGHEPELDRELLARGFHLAYCDVAGLFGSDSALDRWDAFYEFCSANGLAKQVLIEGMSRAGLVALNWAARRPEAVEGIYLDNPVCDFRSWPGHQRGTEQDGEWQACLAAYGLNDDTVDGYAAMPLDRLEPLAKAAVPLFLVQSGADEVVPGEQNGEELVRRYQTLGGEIEVWRKPGVGHHPHGLHPVQPLLRALLRVSGRGGNPATHPTPSAEYRGSAAGWGAGTWWAQLEKLVLLAKEHPQTDLVFLGDSITQGLSGNQNRVGQAGGTRAFDRFPGALSLGLSGDRTEHLLFRIRHGALQIVDPRLVVLQIGVNNVNAGGHTGAEVSEGLSSVVDALLEEEPQAQILICGPFPTGATPSDVRRLALDRVHERAAVLGSLDRVHYMDLRPLFLDEHGIPNERMRGDFIHITNDGVDAWMDAITPLVRKLLAE